MYEKIKRWYRQGLWTEKMVSSAVGKLLTQEEAMGILERQEA